MPLAPAIDTKTLDPAVIEARRAAVSEAVAKIRSIEAEDGVTRPALDRICEILVDLAAKDDLFDREHFPDPDPDAPARLYVLSEDDGGRFPLYLTCSRPGGRVPPHNHTTWAVVVGLSGEEENRLYDRTDGGDGPGHATLEQTRQVVLRGGDALAMMPDDIHSVHTPGDEVRRHFHMYGLSLEKLPERIFYDLENQTCKFMPANPKIVRVAHA